MNFQLKIIKTFLFLAIFLIVPNFVHAGTVTMSSGNAVRGPWIGYGVNIATLNWSSSKPSSTDWTNTYAPRLGWAKFPFYRIMMSANYNSSYLTQVYRILDYAKANNVQVQIAEWGNGWDPVQIQGHTLGDSTYTPLVTSYMQNLINTRGYTNIKYFTLGNEPNYDPDNYSGLSSYMTAINNQTSSFTSAGLTNSNFVIAGPDTSNADDWLTSIAQSSSYRSKIGAYDMHVYAYDSVMSNGGLETQMANIWNSVVGNDPAQASKPFVIGEAGMWDGGSSGSNSNIATYNYGLWMADYAVQAARSKAGAIAVWSLDNDGVTSQDWGLWATKTNGYTLRPWWYSYSLMSRFVPTGATIYAPTNPSSSVRVMGAKTTNGKWTFVAVNRGGSSADVTFTAPDNTQQDFKYYLYSSSSQTKDANGIPTELSTVSATPSAGITKTVPASSAILLTSVDSIQVSDTTAPSAPSGLSVQ